MKIVNLTQHQLTSDQLEDIRNRGWEVQELRQRGVNYIKEHITFDTLPNKEELERRASELADFVKLITPEVGLAVIGGAPFFQSHLEKALKDRNITPVHAFSTRNVIEKTMEDGSVEKMSVFKHQGFIFV